MSSWVDIFYYSFLGAVMLLSAMGIWFTAVIPGLDRWSKRFFLCYFAVFMLCCLSSLMELIPLYFSITNSAFYYILAMESLLLSIPLPMLTVYLQHCRGKTILKSKLIYAVAVLWSLYALLVVGSSFIGGFTIVTPDNHYIRGPLYPFALLPMVAILMLNLAGTIRSRRQLSRKVYLGFIIAILPMMLTLIVQLFTDVFPLLDISYVLSALSMYSLVLSDQIEKDRLQQQKIAHQRASIMVLQMRPHFIYNTLMSIYSLCNQDPQKARQVTKDFTNYLRKNFNAVVSESAIPFTEELEHTRAYLAVEQAQFEEMLTVDLDTEFTRFRLPPLTLQPLVENAVKHGMNPYAGPLHITIRTRHTDLGAEITVADNGPGFDPSDESKPHTTLTNIRQRLEMMCKGSLSINSNEGGGTVVTVTIPDSANE